MVWNTMGSVLSTSYNYAKWLLGYGCESQNSGQLTPYASPFIYKKKSNLFMDEDGDVANEFYTEYVIDGQLRMKKTPCNELRQQGVVDLRYPRLHVDFPVAIYQENN